MLSKNGPVLGQSEITQYVELQRPKRDEHRGIRTDGHEMCRGQPRMVEATKMRIWRR